MTSTTVEPLTSAGSSAPRRARSTRSPRSSRSAPARWAPATASALEGADGLPGTRPGQAARRRPGAPATMLAGAYRGEVRFYDRDRPDRRRPGPGAATTPRSTEDRRLHAAAGGPGPGRAGRPDRRLHARPGPRRRGQPRRPARSALVRPDAARDRRPARQRAGRRRAAGRALRSGDRDLPRRRSATCSRAEDVATLRACVDGHRARGRWPAAERFALVHGDYRLDNLMFPPDGGAGRGRASTGRRSAWRCRPATWPTSLGTGLSVEDRRDARAATSSRRTTRRCTSYGVAGYSLEDCWDDYRFAMVQGPLVAVFGCAYGDPDRARRPDVRGDGRALLRGDPRPRHASRWCGPVASRHDASTWTGAGRRRDHRDRLGDRPAARPAGARGRRHRRGRRRRHVRRLRRRRAGHHRDLARGPLRLPGLAAEAGARSRRSAPVVLAGFAWSMLRARGRPRGLRSPASASGRYAGAGRRQDRRASRSGSTRSASGCRSRSGPATAGCR